MKRFITGLVCLFLAFGTMAQNVQYGASQANFGSASSSSSFDSSGGLYNVFVDASGTTRTNWWGKHGGFGGHDSFGNFYVVSTNGYLGYSNAGSSVLVEFYSTNNAGHIMVKGAGGTNDLQINTNSSLVLNGTTIITNGTLPNAVLAGSGAVTNGQIGGVTLNLITNIFQLSTGQWVTNYLAPGTWPVLFTNYMATASNGYVPIFFVWTNGTVTWLQNQTNSNNGTVGTLTYSASAQFPNSVSVDGNGFFSRNLAGQKGFRYNNATALAKGNADGEWVVFTNLTAVGTITATNGYVAISLNNIPSNSIPAYSGTATNWWVGVVNGVYEKIATNNGANTYTIVPLP